MDDASDLQIPKLADYLKGKVCKGFAPVPHYSVTGDMLHIYFEDEPGYAETVNESVTVIRAFSDKRVVGVKLFGMPALIRRAREEFAEHGREC